MTSNITPNVFRIFDDLRALVGEGTEVKLPDVGVSYGLVIRVQFSRVTSSVTGSRETKISMSTRTASQGFALSIILSSSYFLAQIPLAH